ncbi:MAG: hypothetical protein CM15mV2_3040 [uncultured marine virus]|nr:MAG: hypothetical protein CM15mV2_3040 [uncultured marine virus]
MFKYDAVSPPVSGWLEISLEKEIIDYLWKIERESRFPGTSVKNTLAGNITESRSLKDTDDYFLKNVLLDCVKNYKEEFPYTIRKPDTISDGNLTLNGFWVNYQKQHEFNPMHDHGGAYSFVIWMKIPTKSQEQHNLGFLRGMKNACASNFEMTYLNTTGELKHYPYFMDPDKEGKMLFFPASMKHAVHPFYGCPEERISISGNLYYT